MRKLIEKTKNKKLSLEQKKHNRDLASIRIVIEHVYRSLKIFRILSERYRNRHSRFSLRFNLIAGIYNYELSKASKYLAIATFARGLMEELLLVKQYGMNLK